ncbi:hypothetical protein BC567DRAFT_29025 [Phyllosticta citribraziliensis]
MRIPRYAQAEASAPDVAQPRRSIATRPKPTVSSTDMPPHPITSFLLHGRYFRPKDPSFQLHQAQRKLQIMPLLRAFSSMRAADSNAHLQRMTVKIAPPRPQVRGRYMVEYRLASRSRGLKSCKLGRRPFSSHHFCSSWSKPGLIYKHDPRSSSAVS